MVALADAMARMIAEQPDPVELRQQFTQTLSECARRGQHSGLRDIVRKHLPDTELLILMVDQFEELYSFVVADAPLDGNAAKTEKANRDYFVSALLQASADPTRRVIIVLTLRSDFLSSLTEHPALSNAVAQSHEIVPAMGRNDLRQAIVEPARIAQRLSAGREDLPLDLIDEPTVERILDQVEEEDAALPLMQFALYEIWQRMTTGVSPSQALSECGGVGGALVGRVEGLFGGLSENAKMLVQQAFVATVQVADGASRDTRRRAWLDEAITARVIPEEARRHLDAFIRNRLLVIGATPKGRTWLELPHEALIHRWSRLQVWIETARDSIRFQRRLLAAAQHWIESNRPSGLLWRSPDLEQLQQYYDRSSSLMSRPELEFWVASRRRGKVTRLIGYAVTITVLLTSLGVAAVLYAANRDLLVQQSRFLASAAREQTESGNTMLGILLSLEALSSETRTFPRPRVPEAEMALFAAIEANREVRLLASPDLIPNTGSHSISSVAFSPDGLRLLTASVDGWVRMWAVASGEELRSFQATGDVIFVRFSPDGSLALSVCNNGAVQVWDSNSGRELHRLLGRGRRASFASFSLEGERIVSVAPDWVTVWNTTSGEVIGAFSAQDHGAFRSAELSRIEAQLLTISEDGSAEVWDLEKNRKILTLPEDHDPIESATFSRDEQQLLILRRSGSLQSFRDSSRLVDLPSVITEARSPVKQAIFDAEHDRVMGAYRDGRIFVTDLSTGTTLLIGDGVEQEQTVTVSTSPNERLLATATTGASVTSAAVPGIIQLWGKDTQSASLIASLKGHAGAIESIAFSPDSTLLATGSEDGTTRLWDARDSRSLATLIGYRNRPSGPAEIHVPAYLYEGPDRLALAFSPDNTEIAIVSDGGVIVWDTRKGRQIRRLKNEVMPISGVAFHPRDSAQLVTASDKGELRFWDLRTDAPGSPINAHSDAISTLVYSADGNLLLTTSLDGSSRLWDTASHVAKVTLEPHSGPILCGTLSPDLRYVVTGSIDGTARVWSARTGEGLSVLAVSNREVTSVGFSGDGRSLLTVAGDGLVRVWRMASILTAEGKANLHPLVLAHKGLVWSAEFSPDGARIITSSLDGSARLWSAASGDMLHEFTENTGAEITFAMFIPWQTGQQRDTPASNRWRLLLTSSSGVAELYDADAGTLLARLIGHHGRLTDAAFAARSGELATAATDGTVRLWRIPPGGDDLINLAKQARTRELSPEERRRFFLPLHKDRW
jgi:WD40 repeat protein